jgi:hypothetical protein
MNAPFLIGTHGCSRRAIKQCLENKFIQLNTENVWGTDVERACITEAGRKELASGQEVDQRRPSSKLGTRGQS